MSQSPNDEFWRGVRATVPMIVGAIPFGILFGALAINAGLSVMATLGFSLIVYAGSAQFVAAGLIATGAGTGVVVLTTFFVNLRHALYAISIGPYLKHLPQRWLLPLGFWLTDETYAAIISRFRESEKEANHGPNKHWFQLGSSLAMYSNWQLCTVIGVVAGSRFEQLGEWGLEFAIIVTFIGIVVPLITRMPMLVCAVVAAGAALLFRDVPHQLGLIVASILGIAAGYANEVMFEQPGELELNGSGESVVNVSGDSGSNGSDSNYLSSNDSGLNDSGLNDSGLNDSRLNDSGLKGSRLNDSGLKGSDDSSKGGGNA